MQIFSVTNEEIRDYYDSNPNITLAEIASRTGKSIREIKIILMGGEA